MYVWMDRWAGDNWPNLQMKSLVLYTSCRLTQSCICSWNLPFNSYACPSCPLLCGQVCVKACVFIFLPASSRNPHLRHHALSSLNVGTNHERLLGNKPVHTHKLDPYFSHVNILHTYVCIIGSINLHKSAITENRCICHHIRTKVLVMCGSRLQLSHDCAHLLAFKWTQTRSSRY